MADFCKIIAPMNLVQCLYIQGCARSGNTLMRDLCASSFRGAELVMVSKNNSECALKHLIEPLREAREKKSRKIFIVSRDRETSLAMSVEMLRENPTIKVIWMLRNPLDILTSTHANKPGEFYVEPERLFQSFELYRQFRNEPQVLTVRYEDLVSNPNAVQRRIAESFHLEAIRDFTEAYEHFPRFKENVRALHSIRPIDSDSVDKWKKTPAHVEYLKKVLTNFPAIVPLAHECGYEI
jgi:Sulfotransferase family